MFADGIVLADFAMIRSSEGDIVAIDDGKTPTTGILDDFLGHLIEVGNSIGR